MARVRPSDRHLRRTDLDFAHVQTRVGIHDIRFGPEPCCLRVELPDHDVANVVPDAPTESPEEIEACFTAAYDLLIGKQTIH